ncbi:polysaccharide deacetylase family protein [Desulfococcaceae bacterium HSG9]|nr:polysaccharide deacetylase family protein [Desulfococcaceae bacterium HSG9]
MFKRIPVIGGLQRTIEGFRKKFASKAAILMYHRVIDMDADPWSLCVSPQHFAEHLEILRKHAHPISLQQLVQVHKDGNIPDRAVAVTFDDGYADNLHNAKPLLEQYSVPATVFVANGALGQAREFWWNELERILLQPGTLPETLEVNIKHEPFCWVLGKDSDYSEDAYQSDCGWIVDLYEYPTSRHSLYFTLHQLLQPLPDAEVYQVMDELLAWSGKKTVPFSINRTLSKKELLLLKQGELIEIGAHTVSHPSLSMLSKNRQQDEIMQNKIVLEEYLGQQVNFFAYPYGKYSMQTRTIVQEAGFACACTIDKNCVWHGSDPYLLPRITMRDWGGENFLKQLNQILK